MPVTVAASERPAASALKKFGQRLGDLIMWLSRKKCANSRSPSMENLNQGTSSIFELLYVYCYEGDKIIKNLKS